MAAVVFADGESWVVSGAVFRMLISSMRELVDPRDIECLHTLDGYEAVKGITLSLLQEQEQNKVSKLIAKGTAQLISDLDPHGDAPTTAELRERLLQLRALVLQYYGLGQDRP